MKKRLQIILLLIPILSGCATNFHIDKSVKGTVKDWTMTGFVKADSINPILQPSPDQKFLCPISKKAVKWEERNVLNPAAIVRDGKVYLIYRAQDNEMTSRLGMAISDDGLHFTKEPEPVFYPGNDSMKVYEWKGGVEDPRITEREDGTYIMTYTAYDGKTARLCLASSKDLRSWTKHGLVLSDPKYKEYWSKSGAIVSKLENGRTIAAKVNGKYWMYFGDTDLFMATSDDLIAWRVIESNETGKIIPVLNPRPGYFDSRLVEPGPFALLRDDGILLIYNGSNAYEYNDPQMPGFTYSSGQALFDRGNPFKLINRIDHNFLRPDKTYEKTGEVNEVCFVEGLVYFNNQWLLYYGTADSKIAVAVRKEE